jgi:hypothetical protein
MAYLKPKAFTRHVVNPLASRLQTGGVATLTVPGRRTRRARTVPVIPVEVEGIRYLVSRMANRTGSAICARPARPRSPARTRWRPSRRAR